MKRAQRIIWAVLRTAIGLGLLVYLGVSGAIKWSALLGLASAWKITLVALFILWVDMVVTAWRLCVLLTPRGLHLSLNASLRLTLVGTFFNSFLPGAGGGDVVKIFYATQGNRGRRTEVATILLLDRAAGMFGLLVWPLLVLPLFPEMLRAMPSLNKLMLSAGVVAGAMLVGILVCFSSRVRTSKVLCWVFEKLPGGNHLSLVFDTVHSYRHNIGALWASVGISLLAHTLTVFVTLLAARATVSAAMDWKASVVIPLGFLVNTLPLTPGGLGVGEAAFDALFAGVGLNGGAETLLAWRLIMFLISLLGLVYYLQGRQQFVYSAESAEGLDAPTQLDAGAEVPR
jgi:uncharacterized membrane protein YbhN (UPF0104 family)